MSHDYPRLRTQLIQLCFLDQYLWYDVLVCSVLENPLTVV
jgi:hypothetical protein